MNDELQQLLRHADDSANAPALDIADLPNRIRRAARNQRRLAAGGLALLLVLIGTPILMHHNTVPNLHSNLPNIATTDLDAELHERTAALLQAYSRPHRVPKAPDAFLVNLQMERNRAALVLLRDARRGLDQRDPLAPETLKRTVTLFPDTPAATIAAQQLQQLDSSKRQS